MTPERMAKLVAAWVRFYTRSLPPDIVERRVGEIDADLHDHIAHERERGIKDRRIALSIAARMVRGMAADLSWRRSSSRSPVVRVALVTAAILLVPLVATLFTDGAAWGVADFVFAAILLGGTGLLLDRATRTPGNLAYRAGAVVIGIAAIVFGEADDAPGLVLFGLLLIVGAVALTVRTALRSE